MEMKNSKLFKTYDFLLQLYDSPHLEAFFTMS